MSTIRNTIMRRVYYSYSLSVATHQMFWQGIVLGGSVALFGRLTHVASIIHNFLSVPITQAPRFVSNAFINALASGELLTVVVVLTMVGITLSFLFRLSSLLQFRFIPAHV